MEKLLPLADLLCAITHRQMAHWDISSMPLPCMTTRGRPAESPIAAEPLNALSNPVAALFFAEDAKGELIMVMYRRSRDLGVVLHSTNATGDWMCVDFFQRFDDSFGYEEYRRDTESGEGWFPIGFHSGKIFETLAQAKLDAAESVAWLDTEF